MKYLYAILTVFAALANACRAEDSATSRTTTLTNMTAPTAKIPDGAEAITLAAGCFWCTEAIYQQIPGVLTVTSGYTGGSVANPSYEQVSTGLTGHAEACRVVFDTKKTSLEKILEVFWELHDPTTLNRQGADS